MINVIDNQETLIYVVDADTKQLIRKNLIYGRTVNVKDPDDYVFYRLMSGGVVNLRGQVTYDDSSPIIVDFEESLITKLGYDFKSITGNEIKASYDPELDGYLFPSVAIIYMSKLK